MWAVEQEGIRILVKRLAKSGGQADLSLLSRDFYISSHRTHLKDCIYLIKHSFHNKFIFSLAVLSNTTNCSC